VAFLLCAKQRTTCAHEITIIHDNSLTAVKNVEASFYSTPSPLQGHAGTKEDQLFREIYILE